ncbi:heme-binding domain-containing protein [Winogradskyella bathintestinalis]|uniref:Heme-binding domain-containing protein n=1 Tax=Winogradskyella bathintestinalis TaxID=3035208 RepID=A0ABT7ZVG8_9FLAO|nr:heme-binding domain-containing protein [Winogradskyella bathintestinalis]MDN3493022.1 heme-binding domain-containing protein [Winogradskyella bathintestinalis]
MKILKTIGLILLIVIIIAQFFGPEKNNGDISSVEAFYTDTQPPQEVKLILQNTCNDCHSDHTRYPWYDKITPVNYWLADHIEDGKRHFNISKWHDYSDKKKDHKLDELIEMVEEKEMPLPSYTWTHGDADLSEEQINAVISWAKTVRLKYVFLEEPQ